MVIPPLLIYSCAALCFFIHFICLWSVHATIRRRGLLSPLQYAYLSLALYYDLGLLVGAAGFETPPSPLSPLSAHANSTRLILLIFVAITPMFLLFGSMITGKCIPKTEYRPLRLLPSRRLPFYCLTVLLCASTAGYGWTTFREHSDIWLARATVGTALGTSIIVLYLPLHFLAFYVRLSDYKCVRGRLFALVLVVACILSMISIGQRTLMLLPAVIVVLFGMRIKLSRLAVLTSLLIAGAAILLPMFKWQYASTRNSSVDLITSTFTSDIVRAPALARVIEETSSPTSKVMPYPMAGYVYSSLFFIPRSIAPYKGVSTAQYFTAAVMGTSPENTQWGLGIGMLEETLLNGGFFISPLLIIAYGSLFAYLARLETQCRALFIPNRLAALFLFGTHLPALLLMFATMACVGLILEHAFCHHSAPGRRMLRSSPIAEPQRYLAAR